MAGEQGLTPNRGKNRHKSSHLLSNLDFHSQLKYRENTVIAAMIFLSDSIAWATRDLMIADSHQAKST